MASGGAIITWYDNRSGNRDIYAQRVNSDGAAQWTADGVAICTASGDQNSPRMTSDGSGGAIITWYDNRSGSYDYYAQRVDSAGAVQWTADGVAICTASGVQMGPQITSDGSGGAIIAWYDYRSGSNNDIYAQRVNSAGVVQWIANGVAVCTSSSVGPHPRPPLQIISDGSAGAIITWYDYRSGSNYDIYAQRVDSAGVVQWTADGVAICTNPGNQEWPQIISDGSAGAIITWHDDRSGNWDIYAQRVDSVGAVQWTADGVAICTAPGDQYSPQMISDGSGGAIIIWDDDRSGSGWDVYAQRANSDGAVQWTANGVAISTASGSQDSPQMTSDESGGAIITWDDSRSGNWDIYAQRVESTGNLHSDATPPTVTLTSTATSPTKVSPIPMTATFSEAVTGFVVGDITVGNGTAGNFVAVSTTVYTFDVTPAGQGAVTVDVAADLAQDAAGNGNTAATQYSVTYDTLPTITSFTTSSTDEGDSVIITGTNFTGATAVKFGDTDALSFTVDSDTRITAVVSSGTSGKITVTTAEGTATSAHDFPLPAGSVNWWLVGGIIIAVVILFGAIAWWRMGLRRKGG